MKIPISKESVSLEELKTKLCDKFPGYEFNASGKKLLIAKKSRSEGAYIQIKKNSIKVVGNFPTLGGQILFVLSLLLLGFIIGLLIYFIMFRKKLNIMEAEIGEFIKEEYGRSV